MRRGGVRRGCRPAHGRRVAESALQPVLHQWMIRISGIMCMSVRVCVKAVLRGAEGSPGALWNVEVGRGRG